MIHRVWSAIVCRVLGRCCPADRPATKNLRQALRQETRRTEAQTVMLRKRREDLVRTFRRSEGDFLDEELFGERKDMPQ